VTSTNDERTVDLVPPSPDALGLLGHVRELKRDPLGFLLGCASVGGVVKLKLGLENAYLITRPEDIERIFQSNRLNYTKATRMYAKARQVLRTGMLVAEGDVWEARRHIATEAMKRGTLTGFSARILKLTDECAERCLDREVNIGDEMMKLALLIVGHTLLGDDMVERSRAVDEALDVILCELPARVSSLFDIWELLPTRRNRAFRAAIDTLDRVAKEIIRQRQEHPTERRDLLSTLMTTPDPKTGKLLTPDELRDEILTFLIAGHETTANLMAWTFYLLSQNDWAIEILRQEADQAYGSKLPADRLLGELRFTEQVLNESLRLYPPVWLIRRYVVNDDVLGRCQIPARSTVIACPFVTQRLADLWPDPERFDPGRFDESRPEHPRLAWFPFGYGPRKCVGSHFALLEAKLILSYFVHKTSFLRTNHGPIAPQPLVTLRMKDALNLKMHRR
jgi:cytochrome P450